MQDNDDHIRRTYLFKVFCRAGMTVGPDGFPIEWWMQELESLDGEVLFLGGSGSRSFAASEFGGGVDDAGCIYFSDDHCYPPVEQEGRFSYFWSVDWFLDMKQKERENQQPCRDIGRFCMRSESVAFLKDLPCNERRSPPTWLYLSDRRGS